MRAKADRGLNAKAQSILDKISRGREQTTRLRKPSGESDITLTDIISSMALAIPGLNLLNIWDLTYYAFYDQFQRYQQKSLYESSASAALAGAKVPKNNLKDWIRPIEK